MNFRWVFIHIQKQNKDTYYPANVPDGSINVVIAIIQAKESNTYKNRMGKNKISIFFAENLIICTNKSTEPVKH